MRILNFNSSMVRLVEIGEFGKWLNTAFQFQYGAIGRAVTRLFCCRDQLFQFQYGAIGSSVMATTPILDRYFNSSMVRLVVRIIGLMPVVLRISIPVWCDW